MSQQPEAYAEEKQLTNVLKEFAVACLETQPDNVYRFMAEWASQRAPQPVGGQPGTNGIRSAPTSTTYGAKSGVNAVIAATRMQRSSTVTSAPKQMVSGVFGRGVTHGATAGDISVTSPSGIYTQPEPRLSVAIIGAKDSGKTSLARAIHTKVGKARPGGSGASPSKGSGSSPRTMDDDVERWLTLKRLQGDITFATYTVQLKTGRVVDLFDLRRFNASDIAVTSNCGVIILCVSAAAKQVSPDVTRMLSMLHAAQMRNLVVLVTKMDEVNFAEERFEQKKAQVEELIVAAKLRSEHCNVEFIAVAAEKYDVNLMTADGGMTPWYTEAKGYKSLVGVLSRASQPRPFPSAQVTTLVSDLSENYLMVNEKATTAPHEWLKFAPTGAMVEIAAIERLSGESNVAVLRVDQRSGGDSGATAVVPAGSVGFPMSVMLQKVKSIHVAVFPLSANHNDQAPIRGTLFLHAHGMVLEVTVASRGEKSPDHSSKYSSTMVLEPVGEAFFPPVVLSNLGVTSPLLLVKSPPSGPAVYAGILDKVEFPVLQQASPGQNLVPTFNEGDSTSSGASSFAIAEASPR